MRIIAGKWRGATLLSPRGSQTRPILDQVKEAVFNILGARLAMPGHLPPGTVLDLYSGTGTLGLEALSRGADYCLFVEKHARTVATLRENIRKLGAGNVTRVLSADATRLDFRKLQAPQPWSLVFVDPPYKVARDLSVGSVVVRLLDKLVKQTILEAQASIVLRHPSSARCAAEAFTHCAPVDQRIFGDMTVSFLAAKTD